MKNATRPSNKKKFQRRTYYKSKKEKGLSLHRALKYLSKRVTSDIKVQHITSMPCVEHSAIPIRISKLEKTNTTSQKNITWFKRKKAATTRKRLRVIQRFRLQEKVIFQLLKMS